MKKTKVLFLRRLRTAVIRRLTTTGLIVAQSPDIVCATKNLKQKRPQEFITVIGTILFAGKPGIIPPLQMGKA